MPTLFQKTVVSVWALCFTIQSSIPALAAAGDDPASVIATRTAPGETTTIINGPAGFQIVVFRNAAGTVVSRIESGTANSSSSSSSSSSGGNAAQQYADTAAHLASPFFPAPPGPPQQLQFIFEAQKKLPCEIIKSDIKDLKDSASEAQDEIDTATRKLNETSDQGSYAASLYSAIDFYSDGLAAAEKQIQEQEAELKKLNCKTYAGGAQGSGLTKPPPPFAMNRLGGPKEPPLAVMPGSVSYLASGNGGPGSWFFSVDGSFSYLDDKRVNADRNANITSVNGTLATRLSRDTVAGVQFTLKDGEVTSKALLSSLEGTYYGASFFTNHALSEDFAAFGSIGYTHGANDLNLNGITGSFNTYAITASFGISGKLDLGDSMIFKPSFNLAMSRVKNNRFVASNGLDTPSKTLTHSQLSLGGTFSRAFAFADGMVITPSVGLHGVLNARSEDLALINGATGKEAGLGATLSTGIKINQPGSFSFGLNGGVGSFGDVNTFSVSGRIGVPLN